MYCLSTGPKVILDLSADHAPLRATAPWIVVDGNGFEALVLESSVVLERIWAQGSDFKAVASTASALTGMPRLT